MRTRLAGVSKGDFVAIAGILCTERASASLKQRIANYFGNQNPQFDEKRFLKATNACKV